MLTRSSFKNKKANLISATRISNYIKNDMILDYLDLLDENKIMLDENFKITKKRTRTITDNPDDPDDSDNPNNNCIKKKSKSSFDYIVESGYIFESDIMEQIELMMLEKNENKKIFKLTETNINLNCEQTINTIINNKHTIILNSILINKKNFTWGKPDLLVKGEWIEKYIQNNMQHLNLDSEKWYVIDIKSSTINLINKGEDISSKLLYNVYKSQIYIYTDALNELLKEHGINNNVNYGFILGKKYKYSVSKNIIIKKPFEYLGIIDFNKEFNNGDNWKNTIINAVSWINDLRTNWQNFKVNPINKDELYPNMKNTYDKNWHRLKKEIAVKNKEITLLWNCGMSNRKLAWVNGIKHYDDPKLTSTILGFKGSSKETIVSSMLELLHTDKIHIIDKLNDHMEWQSKSKWEFFVDFETYNIDAIYDENNDWDNIFDSKQKIYMIGISYFINKNVLVHKTFILEYKNCYMLEKEFENNTQFDNVKYGDCIFCKNELDLIKKFSDFIKSFKPTQMDIEFFKKNIRLCHWSGAEPIIFNKKITEYNLDWNDFYFNWYDLLKIFKHDRYPIIIKECFGFGIKEIVKKLNQYGLIKLSWSDLDDGLLSSFIARNIYMGGDENYNNNMYYIVEYNYIDCKALHYILEWIRKEVSK